MPFYIGISIMKGQDKVFPEPYQGFPSLPPLGKACKKSRACVNVTTWPSFTLYLP